MRRCWIEVSCVLGFAGLVAWLAWWGGGGAACRGGVAHELGVEFGEAWLALAVEDEERVDHGVCVRIILVGGGGCVSVVWWAGVCFWRWDQETADFGCVPGGSGREQHDVQARCSFVPQTHRIMARALCLRLS